MAAVNRFFIALYFRVIEPIMMPNTLDFLGLEVKQWAVNKKAPAIANKCFKCGEDGIRTHDLLTASQAL